MPERELPPSAEHGRAEATGRAGPGPRREIGRASGQTIGQHARRTVPGPRPAAGRPRGSRPSAVRTPPRRRTCRSAGCPRRSRRPGVPPGVVRSPTMSAHAARAAPPRGSGLSGGVHGDRAEGREHAGAAVVGGRTAQTDHDLGDAPASAAAEISAPRPYDEVTFGSRSAGESRCSPQACGALHVGDRRRRSGHRRGPAARAGRRSRPDAACRPARRRARRRNPGRRRTAAAGPGRRRPAHRRASRRRSPRRPAGADRVPANLSGQIRTRTRTPRACRVSPAIAGMAAAGIRVAERTSGGIAALDRPAGRRGTDRLAGAVRLTVPACGRPRRSSQQPRTVAVSR